MARTLIAVQAPPGSYPVLPLTALAAQFVLTVADIVNFNAAVVTGREILLVQNTAAGAGTVTVTSIVDTLNRVGDITAYSLPANSFAILGPFSLSGWKQADGNLYFAGSAVTILFAVIRLPSIA